MNMRKPILALVGSVFGIFLLAAVFLAYHPDLHHSDHDHTHSHSQQDCGICAFAHVQLLSDAPILCLGVTIVGGVLFFLPSDSFVFVRPQFILLPTRGPPASLRFSF